MENKQKNVTLAFVLGLVLPGLGLVYAAPWLVAGLATLAVVIVYKLLGWIPILGTAVMGVTALCSAALGVLYARVYNREGKRAEIKGVSLS